MSGSPMRPRVLVTGASRRIGRAVAVELARRGCDLVLTTSKGIESLETTVAAVREVGGRASIETRRLELESLQAPADAAAALGSEVVAAPLDGVVHNASVYEPSPLESLDRGRLHRDFDVHVGGVLLATAAVREALRRSRLPARPAVVLPLDIHAAGRPRRGWSSYLASKAAQAQLVEGLAVELAPEVRTVGISFGAVMWPEGSDPAAIERYEERVALARSGTPEEAAAALVWALLDAPFVTGTTVRVDGGRWLR